MSRPPADTRRGPGTDHPRDLDQNSQLDTGTTQDSRVICIRCDARSPDDCLDPLLCNVHWPEWQGMEL